MRELAKSVLGFTWAVGLFGVQQVTKAMSASNEPSEATLHELDDVSRAVQEHLSEDYAHQFKAGDDWQRKVVDVFFDAATLKSLDPRAVASTFDPRPIVEAVDPRKILQSGVDLLQRSVDVVRPGGAAAPASPATAG